MKKSLLFVVALIINCQLSIVNCQLVTRADSVNYAFGVGNGHYIRQNVIGADTANAAKLQMYCDGFLTAKNTKPGTDSYLQMMGMLKGADFSVEFQNGYLFGDAAVKAKPQMVSAAFSCGLKGEPWMMAPQAALTYIQQTLSNPARKTTPLTAAAIDSLNMCYGYFEGVQQRINALGADSLNTKKMRLYLAAFDEGAATTPDRKLYLDGLHLGIQLAQNVAQQPYFVPNTDLKVNFDLMADAIVATIRGEQTLIPAAEAENFYQMALQRAQKELTAPLIEKGRAFLRENGKRPEVVTTASGLQYEVLREGTGAKPAVTDTVKVHYVGTLIDGTEFDNSYKRGEPISFPLNRVIRGWTEGLQLMNVGGKYRLYVPYELGYGERGAGSQIPPYATLIFEIELISIGN